MITEVELQNFRTNESITEITGLPILRAYYSILLTTYEELLKRNEKLPKVLELYVPDLAEYLGMEGNVNQKTVHSMYSVHVIDNIFRAAIRLNRKKQPMLNKKGEPFRLPSQSYIINPNISRERNQTAVENVVIIVTTIEQAGNNTPHIKVSTIIERNPQLSERLRESSNPGQLLQRIFKRTWELLREQTNLSTVYKDIKLPDPNDPANIPTMKTLNMVFTFPHEGKSKTTDAETTADGKKIDARQAKRHHGKDK